MFKEKCSSSEAIEALKQGANIYRINGYSKYGKCISSFCGKNTETYGTISNDKFSTGFVLNQEDIMANDWIIEWPKGENNAINSR